VTNTLRSVKKRSIQRLLMPAVVFLLTYLLTIGGTSVGLTVPALRGFTIVLLAIIFGAYLWMHQKGKWRWSDSPINGILLVWLAVILISLAANPNAAPRTWIGLWLLAILACLWWFFHNLMVNKDKNSLTAQKLIYALLIAGIPHTLLAFQEFFALLASGARADANNTLPILNIPRLGGFLGNSNWLGSFSAVLLPLITGCLLNARGWLPRLILATYVLMMTAVLALTYTRGAWVGAALGLGLLAFLHLSEKSLGLLQRLNKLWRERRLLVIASLAIILGTSGLLLWGVFGSRLASVATRAGLYEMSLQAFADKPITGYGLFTMPTILMRYGSIPEEELHLHAHNSLFNIMAELGLLGLITGAISLAVMVRLLWQSWKLTSASDRPLVAASLAALFSFAINHIFDIPAALPFMMLIGIVLLAICLRHNAENEISASRFGAPVYAVLCYGLLAIGGLNTTQYALYFEAAADTTVGNYQGRIDLLNQATLQQPNMPVYSWARGYFLSVAIAAGESMDVAEAIRMYEQTVALIPDYAPAWAALAAMRLELGAKQEALTAMEEAFRRAPKAWFFAFYAGQYAEGLGDMAAARELYSQALTAYEDASLYPQWAESPLRREMAMGIPASLMGQTVHHLAEGETELAKEVWARVSPSEKPATISQVIEMLLALQSGDRSGAEAWYAKAAAGAVSPSEQLAVLAAQALLDGEIPATALDQAKALLRPEPMDVIINRSGALAYSYWMINMPRYLPPQIPQFHVDGISAALWEMASRATAQ
jgi:putative inorganic carbon (hco3(-)) transporter